VKIGDEGTAPPNLVFVHGLFGSQLVTREGKVVFGDDPKAFFPDMLRDPKSAASLVASSGLVTNGLAGTARLFAEQLATFPARSLSSYVYDWRIGVSAVSPGLNSVLSGLNGRTVLIAYSLGGLVAMHALASGTISSENRAKLERLVLIASPYQGSTLALLALSGSPDFISHVRGFVSVRVAKWLSFLAEQLSARLFEAIVPVIANLQTTFDLLPHDDESISHLKLLKKPRSGTLYTSEGWPFWGILADEGRRAEARAMQNLIRSTPMPIEVASIYSSAMETPHYCRIEASPPYRVLRAKSEWGDGIVSTCCIYRPGATLERELTWVEEERGPLNHADLLRHPATYEALAGLVI
jgi:pimeloyl-ACP methyl ester carboxylesterase